MTEVHVLLERILNRGDHKTWSAFVEVCRPRIRGAIRRVYLDLDRRLLRQDLDDLEQEVYLRLLVCNRGRRGRRADGEPEVPPVDAPERRVHAFFAQVACSVVIDALRRAAAAKRGHGFTRSLSTAALDERPTADANPEQHLEHGERIRTVVRRCRQVAGSDPARAKSRSLQMVVFAGCRSGEAARRTGGRVRPSNIDALVSRLRRRLVTDGIVLGRRRGGIDVEAPLRRAA